MGATARDRIISELNDLDCDHIGPYKKDGQFEVQIEDLLAEHGLRIDDDGDLVYTDRDEGES